MGADVVVFTNGYDLMLSSGWTGALSAFDFSP
jgi:hypothetical protein